MTLDNNQSLVKTMSIFLIPLLLSNILQSIGQLVSIVLVGRWIGEDAVAAISAFFPLFFLLVSFSIGIGSGSSILIGQAYGAKNEQRLKEIIGTTLSFTFLIGLSLAVIGGFFCHRYFTFDGDTCKYCGGKCGICQNPIHLHAHLISLFCLYNFFTRNRRFENSILFLND